MADEIQNKEGYQGVDERIRKKADLIKSRASQNPPQEVQAKAISKDHLFSRLNPEDIENLKNVSDKLERILREEAMEGSLLVVGGAIDKPMPRKDIDLAVYIKPNWKKGNVMTELEKAQKSYIALKSIAEDIVKAIPGMQMGEQIEPALMEDGSQESHNKLKTQGSVQLRPEKGIPLELINYHQDPTISQAGIPTRPYVLLSKVENVEAAA